MTDFDGTISDKDTIPLIARAAYIVKPDFVPFSKYTDIYLAAYTKHAAQFEKKYGPVNSLEMELLFQQGMHGVETTSINAIEADGLFKDVPLELIKQQALSVLMRPGTIEYIKSCLVNGVRVIILSLNWSREFIAECLRLNGVFSGIEIVASDFEYIHREGQLVSTGKWDNTTTIRTAIDKRDYLNSLGVEDVWYVGDSGTDLLAGLSATKGIALANTSLVKTLDTRNILHGPLEREGVQFSVATWEDLAMYSNSENSRE